MMQCYDHFVQYHFQIFRKSEHRDDITKLPAEVSWHDHLPLFLQMKMHVSKHFLQNNHRYLDVHQDEECQQALQAFQTQL
jgi:hypothetical protein